MDSEIHPEKENSSMPTSAMLESLLSDPALMDRLQATVRTIRDAGGMPQEKTPPDRDLRQNEPEENDGNARDGTNPDKRSPGGDSLPDGLSAVLSNPELMARLPQVMAMLRGNADAGSTGTRNQPSFALSGKPPAKQSPEDSRNHLLLALKPFLSKERRDAVDIILRISQLGTVLRQMK